MWLSRCDMSEELFIYLWVLPEGLQISKCEEGK